MPVNRQHPGAAIGVLSVALIGSQIVLMQALAQAQWSHFAHMVIAIAMLGFGTSGTLLALRGKLFLEKPEWYAPLCMALCSITLAGILYWAMSDLARFDMMEVFMGGSGHWKLLITYVLFFIPFLFGALAIGILFASTPGRIASFYAWNLAGSALGGPLAIFCLSQFSVGTATGLMAILAFSGALLANLISRSKLLTLIAGLLCLAVLLFPPQVKLSQYKDLARALDLPEVERAGPIPSAMGEVVTVKSPALRFAPALSLHYAGEPPRGRNVFVNGNAYGTLLPASDPERKPHILDATPRGLPYSLGSLRTILVLDAGAGEDVTHAQHHSVKNITAVEPHPVVRELAALNSKSHEGITRVEWPAVTSREYLQRTASHHPAGGYDLIVISPVGTFGGDSGLRAVEENYSLTREAFQAMWDRLSPRGMITGSVWIDYPPRKTLRLANLFADLLEENGIAAFTRHVLIVRNWGMLTFVLSREPLKDTDRERAAAFVEKYGFDLLDPGRESPAGYRHAMQDHSLVDALDSIFSGRKTELVRSYPFDITPPDDGKPFFQHFLKLENWKEYRKLFLNRNAPFLEIGFPMVLLTFVQIALLSLPLVFVPWFRLRKLEKTGLVRALFYFTAVGCGFMLWEMAMIQRFTLYWGHPVYAASGVISILLLGMGMGSRCSALMHSFQRWARPVTAMLALLLALYALLLPWLIENTLGMSLTFRIGIGVILLMPPAFLMGIPFPLGLRWMEEPTRARIGWAWGLDGYASVVSATGAIILSVLFGFTIPVLLAALAYAIAGMAVSGKLDKG